MAGLLSPCTGMPSRLMSRTAVGVAVAIGASIGAGTTAILDRPPASNSASTIHDLQRLLVAANERTTHLQELLKHDERAKLKQQEAQLRSAHRALKRVAGKLARRASRSRSTNSSRR